MRGARRARAVGPVGRVPVHGRADRPRAVRCAQTVAQRQAPGRGDKDHGAARRVEVVVILKLKVGFGTKLRKEKKKMPNMLTCDESSFFHFFLSSPIA